MMDHKVDEEFSSVSERVDKSVNEMSTETATMQVTEWPQMTAHMTEVQAQSEMTAVVEETQRQSELILLAAEKAVMENTTLRADNDAMKQELEVLRKVLGSPLIGLQGELVESVLKPETTHAEATREHNLKAVEEQLQVERKAVDELLTEMCRIQGKMARTSSSEPEQITALTRSCKEWLQRLIENEAHVQRLTKQLDSLVNDQAHVELKIQEMLAIMSNMIELSVKLAPEVNADDVTLATEPVKSPEPAELVGMTAHVMDKQQQSEIAAETQRQNEQLSLANEHAMQENSVLRKENEVIKQEVELLRKASVTASPLVVEECETLKLEITELEAEAVRLKTLQRKCRDESDKAQRNLDVLNQRMQSMADENSSLRRQKEVLLYDLQSLKSDCASLTVQLHQVQGEGQAAKGRVEQLEEGGVVPVPSSEVPADEIYAADGVYLRPVTPQAPEVPFHSTAHCPSNVGILARHEASQSKWRDVFSNPHPGERRRSPSGSSIVVYNAT